MSNGPRNVNLTGCFLKLPPLVRSVRCHVYPWSLSTDHNWWSDCKCARSVWKSGHADFCNSCSWAMSWESFEERRRNSSPASVSWHRTSCSCKAQIFDVDFWIFAYFDDTQRIWWELLLFLTDFSIVHAKQAGSQSQAQNLLTAIEHVQTRWRQLWTETIL